MAKKNNTGRFITLTEIAERIQAHLRRFEADPVINKPHQKYGQRPYYSPYAWRRGRRVELKYVCYHMPSFLDKAKASAYLAWLDAGSVGYHYNVPEF